MVLAIESIDILTALGVAAVLVALCIAVIALAAIACASFYYGRSRVQDSIIQQSTEREDAFKKELRIWHDKTLEVAGRGPLLRQQPESTDRPTGRKFVTAGEVRAALAEADRQAPRAPELTVVPDIPKVPDEIKEPFLRETGAAVQSARS